MTFPPQHCSCLCLVCPSRVYSTMVKLLAFTHSTWILILMSLPFKNTFLPCTACDDKFSYKDVINCYLFTRLLDCCCQTNATSERWIWQWWWGWRSGKINSLMSSKVALMSIWYSFDSMLSPWFLLLQKFRLPHSSSWWKKRLYSFLHDNLKLPGNKLHKWYLFRH